MKGLVLYRSYYGNTKLVAEALANEIVKLGHQAEVRDLRLRLPDMKDIDWAVIGTPTRMGRATWKARWALHRLRRQGFGKKLLGIFDTYGPLPVDAAKLEGDRKWFYPGAVGMLQAKAKKLGLNVYPEVLRCQVKEMRGPLKEGEAEKAAQFAREFVNVIEKKKI